MPVIALTNNDRLLDCVLVHKIVIMSCLLRAILILFSIVVILVVMHILYQSWEFLKKYLPGWRKQKFFWVKQDALYAQVKICRAWRQRRSFLECALRFMWRRLSCIVRSTKSKWNEIRSRKLLAFLYAVYSFAVLLVASLLITTAVVFLSTIAIFLLLFFSMPSLIAAWFSNLVLGFGIAALGFQRVIFRLFPLVFGYSISKEIQPKEFLTFAISLVAVMLSFIGVTATLESKPPSQNVFNTYNRVPNDSTVKTDLKAEFAALTEAIKQLNTKTEKTELSALQQAISNLENRIEESRVEDQKEMKSLRDALNDLKGRIEAIPKDPTPVKLKGPIQVQVESPESPGLQEELKKLQVALNDLQKQQKQIEESQTADRADLRNLQEELRNLQDAMSDLKTQTKTMSKAELECLRKELEALNAQLKKPIVFKPWVIAKIGKGIARILGIGARKQQNGRQQSPPCPA